MTDSSFDPGLLGLTAQIVAAHVSKNPTAGDTLPALIRSVYAALAGAGMATEQLSPQEPAVPIKRSVFPDYLVCLEDGKKLKALKRHLRSTFNMTPEQYREKWGLPTSYPMVAPNYAKRRSELARASGLGRKPAAPALASVPVTKVKEGVRGLRKAKAAKSGRPTGSIGGARS